MSHTVEVFFERLEESVNAEFRSIGSYIETMKSDIANLQANDLQQRHLPTAGRELDAVVSATEEATNTIMEAAEAIMSADPADPAAYKEFVDQEVMKIFEACSFQDITGQRITKVVETLQLIDSRVSRFAKRFRVADSEGAMTEEEASREQRKRELLLDGPAAPGGGIAQDEIDRLLT
jgi:chemotaxis protein CheZ